MSATVATPIQVEAPPAKHPERGAAGGRPATVPPEARGLARDEVRLLVATGEGAVHHARFLDLPRFLRRGDLLVVNTSATLPAAVDGAREQPAGAASAEVTVHFSTALDDGEWLVEVRPPGRATGPVWDMRRGERITFAGDAGLEVVAPYPDATAVRTRLWRARVRAASDVPALLASHGRPIAYGYVEGRWPLDAYQTIFARHPGSAEMPSAGRPFSERLVAALASRGVALAPVLLHTGVSSLEAGEPPLPERFRVEPAAAARVDAARRAGGRIIAVGTTAARALESVAAADGTVVPGQGWTDLLLGAERPARVVDGIVTGWHEPGSSHLHLLSAVAGERTVQRAYREAIAAGVLWHEFGDSCLLLP